MSLNASCHYTQNIIHGDIKPDNLLVTSTGSVKIGDFSVSQIFEDDDDLLWRSPGTPVFTAPECCQGTTAYLLYLSTSIYCVQNQLVTKLCV
jgi:serine/threonine protein kinase